MLPPIVIAVTVAAGGPPLPPGSVGDPLLPQDAAATASTSAHVPRWTIL
jgi:hypothetical protein